MTREYYKLFNVPEVTDCECDERAKKDNIYAQDMASIYGEGPKGIEAIASFLASESGAFTKTGNREMGICTATGR